MRQRIILTAAMLLFAGCRDDTADTSSKSAEAARIEKEVERRVEVVERDLRVRQTRLYTIRVIGFIVLAGGSVALLVRLQKRRGIHPVHTPGSPPPVTRWQDHFPVVASRVMDPPAPEPSNGQPRNPDRPENHHHAPAPRP